MVYTGIIEISSPFALGMAPCTSFPDAVLEIYNSTPTVDRGLRDLAVRVTMDHLTILRTGEEAAQGPFQDNLLESVPQFSFGLLVVMMNRTVSDWKQLGICRKNWSRGGCHPRVYESSPGKRFGQL